MDQGVALGQHYGWVGASLARRACLDAWHRLDVAQTVEALESGQPSRSDQAVTAYVVTSTR